MGTLRGLWHNLSDSFSFAKSLLKDQIDAEVDIDTPLGNGFFFCQVRESKETQNRYVVIKAIGGDSTVFIPLHEDSAKQLISFIQLSFLDQQPKNNS
ncbi:hypothetical protein MESS2_210013 [Mesorhizobium metallidurans STM 2683]|uniref:Uncharacterized protein n=1 Tax=Mesorhizobium metallidurans STM 2683 TaxID=1297569 RepID=M5EMN7_9HYPH|nr:hypothetical protein [Mesorhizobium metallidurans]CCV06024.1 hypothetical protein MESS2_210013 [Mesorhizobium metallidurans STM 2683]